MKTAMAVNKSTQWIAGMAAITATLLTVGGPLTLAEHYAQAGAAGNPDGYAATRMTQMTHMATRGNCPADDKPRTAANTDRRAAQSAKSKGMA